MFFGPSSWILQLLVYWPPWHESKSQIKHTRLCCKPFGITSRFIHFLHHGSSLTILPGKEVGVTYQAVGNDGKIWERLEAWVIAELPSISCNTSMISPDVLDTYHIHRKNKKRSGFLYLCHLLFFFFRLRALDGLYYLCHLLCPCVETKNCQKPRVFQKHVSWTAEKKNK